MYPALALLAPDGQMRETNWTNMRDLLAVTTSAVMLGGLFGLRCALWASPPSITAFAFPAL